MPRVKRGRVRRAKRKKLLGLAKGYYANKSKLYRAAKESVDTALKYAFVGRRRKKRDFRRLWVIRINAAAREPRPHVRSVHQRPQAGRHHAGSKEPVGARDWQSGSVQEACGAGQERHQDSGRAPNHSPTHERPPIPPLCRPRSRASKPSSRKQHRRAMRRPCAIGFSAARTASSRRGMQTVGSAPPDRKREIGRLANELKGAIEAHWTQYQASATPARAPDSLDVTLPGRRPLLGHRHPLTTVRSRLEDIFTRMGFAIVEGPEVEDEWHWLRPRSTCRPNILRATCRIRCISQRPSLATRQTIDGRSCGRTPRRCRFGICRRTSRPSRIVVPGRVYRRDNLDLTHSPAFGQVEGLAVGEGLSLTDLKGTLLAFARQMFSPTVRVRFRPSFFPYTEPSAEIDLSCWQCDGAGCAMCKKTGWIELGGCGMVHPAVFRGGRLRPRALYGLRLGHRHRADRDSPVPGRGYPLVLRERFTVPRAVPRTDATPCFLAPRFRRHRRAGGRHRRQDGTARLRGRLR